MKTTTLSGIKFYEIVRQANDLKTDEEILLIFSRSHEKPLYKKARVLGFDVGFVLLDVNKIPENELLIDLKLVKVIDTFYEESEKEISYTQGANIPVLRS